MRVAIYSGVSRSTTFIERLIDGLAQQGIEVLIFGTHNGLPNASKQVRYFVYGNKLNKMMRLIKYTVLLSLFKPKSKRALDTIIDSKTGSSMLLRLKYYPVLYYQPDIFHLQWAKSVEDWIWVEGLGMRLVVSLRGTHITISPKSNNRLNDVYFKLFPKVSAFHAVSESIALELKHYPVPQTAIYVVKNGLPLHEFEFTAKQQLHKPLKIVSVGRSHFAKGYGFALDAMALLKSMGVEYHYTIVGVHTDEALMYQRSQLGLESTTTLEDYLPFDRIQTLLKDSDILLLPSIMEGIANVVLEAMALGTLVISTDCGGMPEVVVDGATGYLVPVRDVQAMAATILKTSQLTLEDYQKITKNARNFIEELHTEDLMVTNMMNLYKTLTPTK